MGAFAISGLATPSKLLASSRTAPPARPATPPNPASVERVRAITQLRPLNGVTVEVPVVPTPSIVIRVTDLAASLGIDTGTIRWANDLGERAEAAPGQQLVLPPGRGALMRFDPGETLDGFSRRTGIALATLAAFNSHPETGSRRYLQVPAGTPGAVLSSGDVVVIAPGIPGVSTGQRYRGRNNFPYGQCTWYAASRRNVPWNGDAGQWLRAARGIRPEGHVPVVGAISVQQSISPAGHVTYVESVNDDGSFQVAEMNYLGWAVVDHRTMRVDRDGVAGFIY